MLFSPGPRSGYPKIKWHPLPPGRPGLASGRSESPNLLKNRHRHAQGTPTWDFFQLHRDASGFLGSWRVPKGKSPPSLPMGHSRSRFTTQMGNWNLLLQPHLEPGLGSSPWELPRKLCPTSSWLTSPFTGGAKVLLPRRLWRSGGFLGLL